MKIYLELNSKNEILGYCFEKNKDTFELQDGSVLEEIEREDDNGVDIGKLYLNGEIVDDYLKIYKNEIELEVAEIAKKRKVEQYSNITLTNDFTIHGTSNNRDNIFKAHMLDGGKVGMDWLDVYGNMIKMSYKDFREAILILSQRDSFLYFKEASDITAVKEKYKNIAMKKDLL